MKYAIIFSLLVLASCNSKSNNPVNATNSSNPSISGEWKGTNRVSTTAYATTDLQLAQSGENVTGSGTIYSIEAPTIVGDCNYPNVSLIIATVQGQASLTATLSDSVTLSGTITVPGQGSTLPALLMKQ